MKSIYYDPELKENKQVRKWFENVKLIGEIDKGTSIYIEDYAYTYLHQYAKSEISHEVTAVLIGTYLEELEQVAVYGVIPIKGQHLDSDEGWISKKILDTIEEERQCYFPEGEYVGWMHTQPGYGIMCTSKEERVHKEVFGPRGGLMLIDPVSNAETFFAHEEDLLKEKRGFCIYYEKNDQMQKYMEDHPFLEKKEQAGIDQVVDDFRKLGSRWKKEVERRGRRNKLAKKMVAGVLLMTLLIVGLYNQQRKNGGFERDVVNTYDQYSEVQNKMPDNPVEVVFTAIQVGVETWDNTHTVEIGDSLLSISYDYYGTVAMVKEIAELNDIVDYNTIYIGQELKLPEK